jgi:hypothetical protein
LFKALRQVLQGNVADNDVLVIDIDVLGIQMTEVRSSPSFPVEQYSNQFSRTLSTHPKSPCTRSSTFTFDFVKTMAPPMPKLFI